MYRKVGFVFLGFILSLWLIDLVFPFSSEIAFSSAIYDKNRRLLNVYLSPDEKWRIKTDPAEINPIVARAFVFKEDKRFYYHFGVDPIAISRAFVQNLLFRKRTSGASTITMQTVRLLKPRSRTYFNKMIECFNAIQLEMHLSKKEILALYLSITPFGSNIEGIGSAAHIYFLKNPDRLSLAETAALTVIPNKPNARKLGVHNATILLARNKLLKQMLSEKLFSNDQINDALNERLVAQRHVLPKEIPHLARKLKEQGGAQIFSFIDFSKQKSIEALTKQYMMTLDPSLNAAVILINNKTMQVEAYLGSKDFNDAVADGQIDGIQTLRSPGSTLKPLLYGLAIDQGLIAPKSVLEDVPTNFSGFAPENFDKTFRGPVTATFALANSLNIPAVKLLSNLGKEPFTNALGMAGFKEVSSQKNKLGLSMILGGCEVNAVQLAGLFAAFSNGGGFKNPRFSEADVLEKPRSLLSKPAAEMISEMLQQTARIDLPEHFEYTYNAPNIAWKTGTSFAKKDAWCVGFNRTYTLAVWIGHFDNRGEAALSGATMAMPLHSRIFNAVAFGDKSKALVSAPRRFVCSQTGLLPNVYCKDQTLDYYIEGVSPNALCQHQKTFMVSVDGAVHYCTKCVADHVFFEKTFDNISEGLGAYFQTNKIKFNAPPPHYAACQSMLKTPGPIFVFPNQGGVYYIEKGAEIVASCQVPMDIKTLDWYLDHKYIKKQHAEKAMSFKIYPGKHSLSASDEKGRVAKVDFEVLWQ